MAILETPGRLGPVFTIEFYQEVTKWHQPSEKLAVIHGALKVTMGPGAMAISQCFLIRTEEMHKA